MFLELFVQSGGGVFNLNYLFEGYGLLNHFGQHRFSFLAIVAKSALSKINRLNFLPLVIAKCAKDRSIRGSLHTRLGFIVADGGGFRLVMLRPVLLN